MKRTTIMLPDDVDGRLRSEARRRGVPVAVVVREAVERHLPPAGSRRPAFFGMADGTADESANVDATLADIYARRDAARR